MSAQSESGLPDTFEAFVREAEHGLPQCDDCEDRVAARWLQDGRCIGCRLGGDE
ncbi:hypothetical protein VB779_08795 [Haloarculaceae archaeon H-GB11]|nr:hypothetical protein [Haloarculaceae archaeon H-GB11]